MQQNFDLQQLMKLAHSPAGQQLMDMLKQSGGCDAERAASLARSGDMTGARNALSGLLESQEVQKLLRQLEGQL